MKSGKKNIRIFLFEALENKGTTFIQKAIGGGISFLIIANIIALILGTMDFFKIYHSLFFIFEVFSIIIFSIEYSIRIWTASLQTQYESKWGYILSPFMLFDAFVIIPALISIFIPGFIDGRILRIIRVFRIFRLKQYSQSLDKIFSIINRHKRDLISAFSLIFMGVVLASTFMYYAEKDLQPENLGSIPHALYWGFITISTVGYGDITPLSDIGKLITVFTTILGVAIYALPTSILGAAFYAEMRSKEAKHVNTLERKVLRMEELIKKLTRENERLKEKMIEKKESIDEDTGNFFKNLRLFNRKK